MAILIIIITYKLPSKRSARLEWLFKLAISSSPIPSLSHTLTLSFYREMNRKLICIIMNEVNGEANIFSICYKIGSIKFCHAPCTMRLAWHPFTVKGYPPSRAPEPTSPRAGEPLESYYFILPLRYILFITNTSRLSAKPLITRPQPPYSRLHGMIKIKTRLERDR